MGKNAKQSKWADRVNNPNDAGYPGADPTIPRTYPDPTRVRSMQCGRFLTGIHREHATEEISENARSHREGLYHHLLSYDTSGYPPLAHASSISSGFKKLADSMLNLAHRMGSDEEWLALMAFHGAFRARYNSMVCELRTDCIPLDFSIMMARLYALSTSSDSEKDNYLGLDYLFLLAAQMERDFDVSSSDCEQYWTLKFIENARRAAKGAVHEANFTMKLYLYFLVAKLPKILGQH
ncbi:hypothetical protein FLAG1_07443 [Fusarium langsethiae]|uniref:Uncharacterized protein n=1 Tax=Fusarium langsethiae TaxID=179993 RepID=A0A0N0DDH3_FUSLA|nr:hypothetical protein FLAG1_07443 [Fusarium langsethiae]GKU03775.1 unnamed protein product [Fusarium langsethiae]GKU19266.1 unnamed protein product [Fusarium langsethiae]